MAMIMIITKIITVRTLVHHNNHYYYIVYSIVLIL